MLEMVASTVGLFLLFLWLIMNGIIRVSLFILSFRTVPHTATIMVRLHAFDHIINQMDDSAVQILGGLLLQMGITLSLLGMLLFLFV